MSDNLTYEDSELLWEYIHSLGYTKQTPEYITVCDGSGEYVVLIKDTSDNTYYDSANKTWVSDITTLNLYVYVDSKTVYTGSESLVCQGYSNSLFDNTINYILYNEHINSLESLYTNNGVTEYQCQTWIVSSGETIAWYDNLNLLYWDSRKSLWSEDEPELNSAITYMVLDNALVFGGGEQTYMIEVE